MAPEATGGDQSLEELRRELSEAREQQAATAEILASLSSSVTAANQVFAKIAASAARLCDALDATIFQMDGDNLRIAAHHGPIPQGGTLPLTRAIVTGCAVLDRRPVHVADLQVESERYPEGSERARLLGHRTMLAVPLMHAGEAIGAIAIRRIEVRPFTERQIDLLKTFADQAVIAIENARLFEEVQARTRELTEVLEQQTATSEVLSVISSSPTNTQPVFSAIATNAVRLCNAMFGAVFSFDGKLVHFVAGHQITEDALRLWRDEYPISPRGLIRLAITDRAVVNVGDMFEDPRVANVEVARKLGNRSQLVVPMLQGGEVIGTINVYGAEPVPFSDAQIVLLQTFADQAVIAIENTRLFEEVQQRTRQLEEALEHQIATSDVLSAISRSKFDLGPVLDEIARTANRLCAADAIVLLKRGQDLSLVAHHGAVPAGFSTRPISRDWVADEPPLNSDRSTFMILLQPTRNIP
jgi:GAF domain-containing protein